uniref:Protein kinase domain-containing protein n=1 Tax=Caenorhabditis tropicalis TaxID=1561998 RepID=A0A1I7TJ69_9PELO
MRGSHGQKRKADDEEGPSEGPVPKVVNSSYPSTSSAALPSQSNSQPQQNPANYPDLLNSSLILDNIPRYWNSALKLGSGAFGEVHLVHSDRLDERSQKMIHNEFVIKIVRVEMNKLENIIREVKLHRMCRDHENVLFAGVCYCQMLDGGYRVHMCLEYAAMSDMSLFVMKDKTEGQIAYVCREVIKALVYIHEREIVHGDITFKNVLATHRGVIKLSDFGMADTLSNTRIVGKEILGGTPGFIAPEIIRQQGYDGRADVWSLGVLALSFVMRGNPFKQGMLFDFCTYQRQITADYYPDIENLQITDEFREFLDDLKQFDPTERSHAHELTLDLFIVDSCSRREFIEHYKNLRTRSGMDLPLPDEIQSFTVPDSRE